MNRVVADCLMNSKSEVFDVTDAAEDALRTWKAVKKQHWLGPEDDVKELDIALAKVVEAADVILARYHEAHREADPAGTLEQFAARTAAERHP